MVLSSISISPNSVSINIRTRTGACSVLVAPSPTVAATKIPIASGAIKRRPRCPLLFLARIIDFGRALSLLDT